MRFIHLSEFHFTEKTYPKSKFHSSRHRPCEKKVAIVWKMDLWEVEWTGDTTLKRTFCSSLNFSMGSTEVKLISLHTINVSISKYRVTN